MGLVRREGLRFDSFVHLCIRLALMNSSILNENLIACPLNDLINQLSYFAKLTARIDAFRVVRSSQVKAELAGLRLRREERQNHMN